MSKKMSSWSAKNICLTAVMAALVCIMTLIPRIPIPLGYAHLGDAVIFLLPLYFQRRESALAASIGSAAADFLGGFPIWILPTLIIKYFMVEIIACLHPRKRPVSRTAFILRTAAAMLLSALWMAFGYTLAGGLLYGSLIVGLTSAPGLLLEGGINMLVALAASSLLKVPLKDVPKE